MVLPALVEPAINKRDIKSAKLKQVVIHVELLFLQDTI